MNLPPSNCLSVNPCLVGRGVLTPPSATRTPRDLGGALRTARPTSAGLGFPRAVSGSWAGRPRRAVTILELLIAVSLISFIVLALYNMFDQTQEQMRKAVREVDKFESGRSAAELLRRDLSQLVAAYSPLGSSALNFFTGTNWATTAFGMTNNGTNIHMNTLDDVYFLAFDAEATPTNWLAMRYWVADSTAPVSNVTAGLGTLYRWTTSGNRFSPTYQTINYAASNPQRVAENVVHFRVVGTTNGFAVPPGGFLTNADVPTHVTVELGYVDAKTASRARSFGPVDMVSFLSTNVDSVHLFRMHIPIRNSQQ